MNEHNISDEGFWEWHDNHPLKNSVSFGASKLAWDECRRRAEANPWQLFDTDMLEALQDKLGLESIQAELARRKEAK